MPSSPTSRSAGTRASVERDLRDRRRPQAHRLLPRQRVDAGRRRVRQHAGDAGRAGTAGPAEHVVEVGDAGVRDPRLGAVDARSRRRHEPLSSRARRRPSHPAVRTGSTRRAVRRRAWPAAAPRADRIGTVRRHRIARERVHGDRLGDRQPPARQHLEHLDVHLVRLRRAAVGLRVRQPEQSRPAERTDHLARELAARLEVVDPRRELTVGEVGRELEQRHGVLGRQDAFDGHWCCPSCVADLGRVDSGRVDGGRVIRGRQDRSVGC